MTNQSAAIKWIQLTSTNDMQVLVHRMIGPTQSKCGSWLACDSVFAVTTAHNRCAAIAGKPAPTPTSVFNLRFLTPFPKKRHCQRLKKNAPYRLIRGISVELNRALRDGFAALAQHTVNHPGHDQRHHRRPQPRQALFAQRQVYQLRRHPTRPARPLECVAAAQDEDRKSVG